jgi:hypothetical protein
MMSCYRKIKKNSGNDSHVIKAYAVKFTNHLVQVFSSELGEQIEPGIFSNSAVSTSM